MAKQSSRRASEQNCAERRERDRERARRATEALLTSEGWQRWVRARAVFHSYSLQNTLLLAYQCAARGITPTRVGGFRAWLKLGRCVRKGEVALWVMAPMAIKQRDRDSEEPGEERLLFRSVPVFDTLSRDRRVGLSRGAVGRLETLNGGELDRGGGAGEEPGRRRARAAARGPVGPRDWRSRTSRDQPRVERFAVNAMSAIVIQAAA